jgi:hypothetical protein
MLTIKDGTEINSNGFIFKINLRQPARNPIATSFIKGEYIDKNKLFESGEEEAVREIEEGSLKYIKESNWATNCGFDLSGINGDKELVIALTGALQKMLEVGKKYGGTIIFINSVTETPSNIGKAVNIHCSYYI